MSDNFRAGSLTGKTATFQVADGSSNLTPALHCEKVERFGTVQKVEYSKAVREFVERHHYSQTVCGLTGVIAFGLFRGDILIGVALFGSVGMYNVAKKYCPESPKLVIELRRLVLIDAAPKNSESFFVARALQWLKRHTQFRIVLSYADPHFGHSGTIYKALNFEFIGKTSKKRGLRVDGRILQCRILFQKTRPVSQKLRERLAAKDPGIEILCLPGKNIYLYRL